MLPRGENNEILQTNLLRRPLYKKVTASVGAGVSDVVLQVDGEALYFIKSISVTPAGSTAVQSIKIDGFDTGLSGAAGSSVSLSDAAATFGSLLTAKSKVTVTISAASADTTTYFTVYGYVASV